MFFWKKPLILQWFADELLKIKIQNLPSVLVPDSRSQSLSGFIIVFVTEREYP